MSFTAYGLPAAVKVNTPPPASLSPSGSWTSVARVAVQPTNGQPSAIVVRPISAPEASRCAMVTTTGSSLVTTDDAAPTETGTSAE